MCVWRRPTCGANSGVPKRPGRPGFPSFRRGSASFKAVALLRRCCAAFLPGVLNGIKMRRLSTTHKKSLAFQAAELAVPGKRRSEAHGKEDVFCVPLTRHPDSLKLGEDNPFSTATICTMLSLNRVCTRIINVHLLFDTSG